MYSLVLKPCRWLTGFLLAADAAAAAAAAAAAGEGAAAACLLGAGACRVGIAFWAGPLAAARAAAAWPNWRGGGGGIRVTKGAGALGAITLGGTTLAAGPLPTG